MKKNSFVIEAQSCRAIFASFCRSDARASRSCKTSDTDVRRESALPTKIQEIPRRGFNQRFISFFTVAVMFLTACGVSAAPETDDSKTIREEIVETFASEPDEKQEGNEPRVEEKTEQEEENVPKAENSLTGLMIAADAAARRPVAVVINNLRKALPQSGISQADIIYEVLAEGDITRLIAVFRDFSSKKIGPVRSARDYFLNFAFDNDAIFAHHGGSPGAYSLIPRSGVDNIDGMYAGDVFWRDRARSVVAGMYEHSSYTDAKSMLDGIERKGYRVESNGDSPFNFADPVKNELISSIAITYSKSYVRKFEYDAESGLYLVFQGDNPHIDEETGEQLSVANVIAQFAGMYVIDGDEAGRREVRLTGEGNGFLFTNGNTVPIRWSKARLGSPTEWFGEDGGKLTVSRGKTWINVYNSNIIVETSKKAGETD